MRQFPLVLVVLVALGGGACAAEAKPADPPKKKLLEQKRRRARTRQLYNETFNTNMFSRPEQARAAFTKTQRKMEAINPADPGDPAVGEALFQRGYFAVEAKKYKEAIKLFEELVRRYPQHAYADDALYQVGRVYQGHLKDYNKAAAAYTRLAKMYRDRETAGQAMYQNAQVSVRQDNVKDAVKLWNVARDTNRAARFSRRQMVMPNYYEAQSDKQLNFIARNTEPGKGSAALALYLNGENDMDEGRLRAAANNFARIGKKYSESKLADDAAFGLAECRRRSGKLEKAAELYEEFIKKHAGSELVPRARFQLAEFKRLAGREKEARKLYQAVLAALPEPKKGSKRKLPEALRRCRELAVRRLEEMGAGPRR